MLSLTSVCMQRYKNASIKMTYQFIPYNYSDTQSGDLGKMIVSLGLYPSVTYY